MFGTMLNLVQNVAELSLLGYFEFASVAFLLYYIYARTRAPAIIANIFPNLKLNINYYRSSILNFNNVGNELLISLRNNGSNTSNIKKTNKSNGVPNKKLNQMVAGIAREEFQTRGWFEDGHKSKTLLHGIGTENMLQMTPHAGRKPFGNFFDWGIYFPYIAQSVRSRKFRYAQVSKLVVEDGILHRAIKQATDQALREMRLNTAKSKVDSEDRSSNEHLPINKKTDDEYQIYKLQLKKQEKRALKILSEMRSTLNNFLLSLTSWILYKLLPCFLSGVVIHTQQIEMLKKVSEKNPGIPLIFLPLHRSHLDYIMVTFILTNNDIRSPLVAAGNNLQIPVFGGLLRGLGAFFIKRKIDPVVGKKDILYRAILHLYIQHALKLGHNIEFFIEGGRTRTGKPCMPKGGVLSVIVNAFMDHSISDALLVPVSVNYERLVDGNFVREQKGEKKIPETFTKAMSGIWKTLNSNYGLMRIDFNQPYSLRELVNSYNQISNEESFTNQLEPNPRILQHNQSTSSLYGTDVVCEEHRNLIDSISRQVVYDCAAATSVMSTNALAFLLLTRYRKGALDKDLAKSLDDIRNVLRDNKKDMGFSGESMHILNYAIDMLGTDLVVREVNKDGTFTIKPVQTIESFIELSYYSHTLTPHFALQSIIVITFHNMMIAQQENKETKTEVLGVVRKTLLSTALENCDVLRYEYILNKPTQTLENRLEETIDELLYAGIFRLIEKDSTDESNTKEQQMARRIATYIDDTDDESFDNIKNTEEPDIFLNRNSLQECYTLCEVLAPCMQTYLSVAQSLNLLYKNTMLESDFISFVIRDLTDKVKCDKCAYAESISTDSVRNCLKLLEKWSVIEICNQNGLRLLSLGILYETTKESLKTVVQRIAATVPNYKIVLF